MSLGIHSSIADKEEYFPKVSRKLQQEMAKRAQSQSLFASLTTQFRARVLGATEGMHAQLWYELWAKSALPASFKDYYFCRVATVNLGARVRRRGETPKP